MANRKQLINRHSGIENNLPIGDLNLGEIGINHCNVTDAAIYVETNKDNPSSATLATFITEKAINNKINNVVELIENLTDTVELIDSGLTIEIERATAAEESISGDVTTLARTTKDEFKNIVDSINQLSGSVSDGITELSGSTVSEIERSVSADTVLEEEIKLVDSGLTIEIERATAAEESISGDVTTLAKATKEEFKSIDDSISQLSASTVSEIERATSAETALQATIEENEEIVSTALNDLNERLNDSETSLHEEINQLKAKIKEMEEVISAALNDLNTRINKIDGGKY